MPHLLPSAVDRASSDRGRRTLPRLALVGAAVALLLTTVTAASPALAERDTAPTDRPSDRPSDRPVDPAPSDRRPARDLEVLSLHCAIADGGDAATDDATRIHVGCRWRAANHPRAAGYQLWRIVDRDHRELVARGGLDMTGARDVVSSQAHVVRYAVVAVDADGRRVGQSRVQKLVLDDRERDRAPRIRSRTLRIS